MVKKYPQLITTKEALKFAENFTTQDTQAAWSLFLAFMRREDEFSKILHEDLSQIEDTEVHFSYFLGFIYYIGRIQGKREEMLKISREV